MTLCGTMPKNSVRQFVNKSAASAASPDYVRFEAVGKPAQNLVFGCASGQKTAKVFGL